MSTAPAPGLLYRSRRGDRRTAASRARRSGPIMVLDRSAGKGWLGGRAVDHHRDRLKTSAPAARAEFSSHDDMTPSLGQYALSFSSVMFSGMRECAAHTAP